MLRLAKEIAAAAGVPVAVIPAPAYATGLFGPWQRPAGTPRHRGTLYDSAMHRVLLQRYRHSISGVVWYQGEADAGSPTDVYLERLTALVGGLRRDLGGPELFVTVAQLASQALPGIKTDEWLQVQEAQRQLPLRDARTALAPLVDLPRSDEVHLSLAGVKRAGERLARAVLRGAYGLPLPAGPQLLAAHLGQGRAEVELRYDKELTGGAPGLFRITDGAGVTQPLSVRVEGARVLLALRAPARGQARLSYGHGRDPTGPWLRAQDGTGPAALFRDLPLGDSAGPN